LTLLILQLNLFLSWSVAALDVAARREEIARMLAGAEITEEARRAAARLLETA
jgi:DNA repair protein RecN (Recombination protein N)